MLSLPCMPHPSNTALHASAGGDRAIGLDRRMQSPRTSELFHEYCQRVAPARVRPQVRSESKPEVLQSILVFWAFFGVERYVHLARPLYLHMFHLPGLIGAGNTVCLSHLPSLLLESHITTTHPFFCLKPSEIHPSPNRRIHPESFVLLWELPHHTSCQYTSPFA